ncbi:MAG: sunset domain-containing protein [Methanotrichaceae archaeon]
MTSLKMATGMLVVLCFFGVSIISAIGETAYETYENEYFSVEYPLDWNVERSLSAENEGWDYTFIKPDATDYISLIIGADEIDLVVMTSLNNIQNGLFDAQIQHFLDTLTFKISEPATTTVVKKYVGSVNSNKYHNPGCRWAKKIKPDNQIWFSSSEEARAAGYVPCGVCKPP